MADTTNYGWTKPTVGGDSGAWGTIINTALDDIDTSLKTVDTTASAALPKAGGTMTGGLVTKITAAARLDLGSISGATALDLNAYMTYTATIGGATTFSITNQPTGALTSAFTLELTNGGAYAVSWPASVQWANGTPPTLTSAGKDLLVFISHDAGTSWLGVVVAQDIS